ncbi:Ca2+-binding RTX toxin-like protein [Herbaspirillum seropedicae]|uniref:calcium-binding protein n=1 Tax=Herbaspirillum seropedicae TaxID=964 RepID=UPI003398CD6F
MAITITINRMSTLASAKAYVPGGSGAAQHDAAERREGLVRAGPLALWLQGNRWHAVAAAQGITPTAAFLPWQGWSAARWRTFQPIISCCPVRRPLVQARHELAVNKPHQQSLPVALASPAASISVAAAASGQSASAAAAPSAKAAQESAPAIKRLRLEDAIVVSSAPACPATQDGLLPIGAALRGAVQPADPAGAGKAAANPPSTCPAVNVTPSPCDQATDTVWVLPGTSECVPLSEAFPPDVQITVSDCVPVPISTLLKRLFPDLIIKPSAPAPSSASSPASSPAVSPAPAVAPVIPPAAAPTVAPSVTPASTVTPAPTPSATPAVVPAVTPSASPAPAPVVKPAVTPAVAVTPAAVPAPVVPATTPLVPVSTVAAKPLVALISVPEAVPVASLPAPAMPERPAGGKDNSGNDTLVGTKADDTLWGGPGNDTLFGREGNDRLFGEEGDDQLLGGDGFDLLDGGAGNDQLFGGLGNDQMWGGDGDDTMMGSDVGNLNKPLAAGQTDDDLMFGGAGKDSMFGGEGNDQMWGGAGDDGLFGGDGDDKLYGEAGNDHICGGKGNDVIQGGDGDDLIYGDDMPNYFTLSDTTGGDDLLYGGAGNDTLFGGAGNDVLDGGSGNDNMAGGLGDDTYVVDCAGDTVSEDAGEGHDTVVASCSFTLGRNLEDLRLAEGGQFNGAGNALDNLITGNSQDNILDGGRGADTLIGGAGNDTYFVDDVNDKIVEQANEGTDTVFSRISTTLGANLENLTLLDSATPQHEMVNGRDMLVYGYPHYSELELDYSQGDAVAGYTGTCGETSVVNLCIMAGQAVTEGQAVKRAIANGWCVTTGKGQLGGSNMYDQTALLGSYGIRAKASYGYDEKALVKLLKEGRGALVAVNAGKLWDNPDAVQLGNGNHVVTVTGVVCDPGTGEAQGFFIADSGRGRPEDACRYLSKDELRKVADVTDGYMVATVDPIKVPKENLDATGNELDNVITGNRGANLIRGGRGNDTLIGGAGSDTYVFARGDGQDVIADQDATVGNVDTLQLSDLRQTDLWFSQSGNDLRIDVLGGSDRITIKDWYQGGSSGSDNHIERIRTADGYTLYDSDVDKLVQAMASFAPPTALQSEWTPGQAGQGKVLLTITH